MWTEELTLRIINDLVDEKKKYRVIALDLETRIETKSDFLTEEIILGVSLARRLSSGDIER